MQFIGEACYASSMVSVTKEVLHEIDILCPSFCLEFNGPVSFYSAPKTLSNYTPFTKPFIRSPRHIWVNWDE